MIWIEEIFTTLVSKARYFLSEIWCLINARKSSSNKDLIDLYEKKDLKHHITSKKLAIICLFEISETWNAVWIKMPNKQLAKTGKKKNLSKILGLFVLILLKTNPINVIELKNNKISKNSKFDIF